MKKFKYEMFDNHVFYDFNGIKEHLEEMAKSGYMLDKVTNFYWRYKIVEPSDTKFFVTYFHEASDFNPTPTANQQEFLELCEGSGWVLLAELAQMQIFYSNEKNPVPIETDPEITLKSIHRSMKKNFLPSMFLLGGLSVMQLLMKVYDFFNRPIYLLSDYTSFFITVLFVLLMLHFVLIVSGYYIWRSRSTKSVKSGGEILKPLYSRKLSLISLSISTIVLISWTVLFATSVSVIYAVYNVIFLILLFALSFGLKAFLKKKKFSAKVNRIVVFTVIPLITVSALLSITTLVLRYSFGINEREPVEIIDSQLKNDTTNMFRFKVYNDDIPLKLEDFTEIDSEIKYSYSLYEDNETLFLRHINASQDVAPGVDTDKEFQYEILEVKVPLVYNTLLNELLKDDSERDETPLEHKRLYQEVEIAEFRANKVYQMHKNNEPYLERYVVCYDDMIVYYFFFFDVTKDEIARLSTKLLSL